MNHTFSFEDFLKHGSDLIVRVGWENFSPWRLAKEMNLPPHTLYQHIPSKKVFLEKFIQYITIQSIERMDIQGLDSPRDVFFEGVMQRLDCLHPYKAMLNTLSYDTSYGLVQFLPRLIDGFAWIFAQAGIPTSGLKGLIKIKIFGLFYGCVISRWLKDDTPEQSHTLKALDQNLERFMPFFLV